MCEFSCDFSLQSERSRQAKVGDKLVTREFGTGTRRFAAIDDVATAVRLLPGTELAFAGAIACLPSSLLDWKMETIKYQTAISRRSNKDGLAAHDDALEFPDGRIVPLTLRFCRKSGPTTRESPRTRSRRTSIDYGKRSRRMPPLRPSWLLKQADTS